MSDAFVPFLYALRSRGVRVGLSEAIAIATALSKETHDVSLQGFYHVARALCVHRETDLDAFDQAFAEHFRGVPMAAIEVHNELLDWLANELGNRPDLTDEERKALGELDMNELRRLFEERLREQTERHDGGSRWIGTGGTSPFGSGGAHPSGLRVGAHGGGRSAIGVAEARSFRGYRSDLVLDVRQMEVALRKLRSFLREGAEEELDLEATIDETARDGGELSVRTRPRKRSNVRVVLLMDVGGSMDPHAHLVSQLFSAAKRASHFRELRSYYFHNCIYGRVFRTESFREPVTVSDLVRECAPTWKLVLVGDAAMHPAELLAAGDWEYHTRNPSPEAARSGLDWMRVLREHFRSAAWLNPDPPHHWANVGAGGTAAMLAATFPMFPLTLSGLTEMSRELSRKTR